MSGSGVCFCIAEPLRQPPPLSRASMTAPSDSVQLTALIGLCNQALTRVWETVFRSSAFVLPAVCGHA